jgi:hypothetical protein
MVFSILATLASCAPTMSTANYDTDCSADDDCIVVPQGDVCDCRQPKGAINKKDQDAYYEVYERLRGDCVVIAYDCGMDSSITAVCSSGQCTVIGM